MMTEVLFYHLQSMSLESVLPPLLEKSLERGWRVVVQSTSPERAEALDAHLWTYSDDSFLPHATWRVGRCADQPIILSIEEGNPNRANVRFLIDNAALPARLRQLRAGGAWCSTATMPTRWPRRAARWAACKARGFEVTYWAGRRAGPVAAAAIAVPGKEINDPPVSDLRINDNLRFLRRTLRAAMVVPQSDGRTDGYR